MIKVEKILKGNTENNQLDWVFEMFLFFGILKKYVATSLHENKVLKQSSIFCQIC